MQRMVDQLISLVSYMPVWYTITRRKSPDARSEHRAGKSSLPVFHVPDSRSRDFGIRDLSRHFGTACEGRHFLNLGANRAKRVTLRLLGAIKGELLAAAIDQFPPTMSRFVLYVIELLP
jgi:hypothetical protein